jgi:ankyrin repeat protein
LGWEPNLTLQSILAILLETKCDKLAEEIDKDELNFYAINSCGENILFELARINDDWDDGIEKFRLLLSSNKFDVNQKNHVGYTVLHQAVSFGSKEIIKILIEHGADINSQTKNGETPLMLGLEIDEHSWDTESEVELVELLLSYNPKIDLENESGETAFCIALEGTIDSRTMQKYKDVFDTISNHLTKKSPEIFNKLAAKHFLSLYEDKIDAIKASYRY